VLGFGLAVLVLEFFLSQQSALATDKISLFKVITTKDEIVIGLTDDELSKIDGRNAGGVAKMLAAKGAMATVDKTPIAPPLALRNELPESPGIPGVAVYTVWLQPLPASPRLTPRLGLSTLTPRRRDEFP